MGRYYRQSGGLKVAAEECVDTWGSIYVGSKVCSAAIVWESRENLAALTKRLPVFQLLDSWSDIPYGE